VLPESLRLPLLLLLRALRRKVAAAATCAR